MLTKAFYIIRESGTLRSVLGQGNLDFVYVVEIDAANPESVQNIYKEVYDMCASQFCLLVRPGNGIKDLSRVMEYLISISFHYKYERPVLNELFLLTDITDADARNYITKKFSDQGYDKIKYISYSPEKDGKSSEFYVISDVKRIEDDYYDYLKQSQPGEAELVIDLKGDEQIASLDLIKTKMQNAEVRLRLNDLTVYNLRKANVSHMKLNETLSNQIGYYEEILEAKSSYAGMYSNPESGYGKKIREIVEFYHYEYEILPGWFKKLGHLLKVVMGKRTWKSLFNDNVVKYKK